MTVRSVKKRFFISFGANFLRSVVSFASGLLVAKGLHPSGYGDLMFLLTSFVAAKSLLDLGTSNAYYTLLSQQRQSARFHLVYLGWLAFQFGACLLAITLLFPRRAVEAIWLGHSTGVILLAFVASFLQQQVWQTVTQVGEAARRTALVQGLGFIIALFQLAAIGLMLMFGWLSVPNVLILFAVEYGVATLWACLMLWSPATKDAAPVIERPVRDFLREYYVYCKPLALLAVFAFLYEFADRWLLQRFGGSIQQGFFQVANQFSIITLLATTSILKIFWKEIAEASARGNRETLAALYFKVGRALLVAGAVLSGLLIPWSRTIVRETLGLAYLEAWPVLALMLLYPIHQAMGQIGGTFLLARGETRLFTGLSIVAALVGAVMSYFVQAPPSGVLVPGLGLGAIGMALKMVILNIVTTNAQAWMIARRNGWAYDWAHQLFSVSFVIALAYVIYFPVSRIWDLNQALFPGLVLPITLFCLVYGLVVVGLFLKFPSLIGLNRGEVQGMFRGLGA
jgi:O-antigen/teichoic acid export membrane protein